MFEKMPKKEMWDKVREHLSALQNELVKKDRVELERLAENELQETLKLGQVSFEIGAWSKKHEDGRLAVLIHAFRYRFLGWSQSTVNGFFIDENGVISEMQEKDLWDHGY